MEQNNLKTKEFWSNSFVARLYRKFAKRHFAKMHRFLASELIKDNTSSVLDIACGPGDFLAHLFKENQNIQMSGTDISPGMVLYARKNLDDKIKIVEADSGYQPFDDKSFDAVTVMMAFHHFPDQLGSLKEIKRILKSNGKCYIGDVVAKSNLQKKFWNYLEKITGVRGYVSHYTISDLSKIVEEAGYTDFKCISVPGMAKRYKLCRLVNN